MTEAQPIGVVGLGRMGMGLARSLLRVGNEVAGFDTDQTVTANAAKEGLIPASNIGSLARCSVIIIALPDGPDVVGAPREVMALADEGTLIIDCSTVDPATTALLSDEATERGIRFRDAAMAGGPKDAAEGTLLFLVGCPEDEFGDMERILRPIGRDVVRCGNTAAGVTLKVINNLLALTIFLADVEALLLARSADLDIETAVGILNSTGAANAALTGLVSGQLLSRNFEGAFRTSLALKDVRIAVQLAARLGIPLETLAATFDTFASAVEQGYGEMAAGAAGLVLEGSAGLSLVSETKEVDEV